MIKNDIILKLMRHTKLTESQATCAVDHVISIISDAIASGDTIYLRGFGSFKTVQRAAKTARNISTGTPVVIPAHRQVKFIAYKQLKSRIENGLKDNQR